MTGRYRQIACLTLFAIAMAQVEAALVIYLRTIYYPHAALDVFPLAIFSARDLRIELVRETATIIMILCMALLAEKGFSRVTAAFLYVFGVWDLCYYAWLKLTIAWPQSLTDWDVLFLIPWPWFGPWITPALIALMFAVWGGWMLCQGGERRFTRDSIILFALGTVLALAAFLLPAAPLLEGGAEAFRDFTPAEFPWLLFDLGYVSMLAALWLVATRRAI